MPSCVAAKPGIPEAALPQSSVTAEVALPQSKSPEAAVSKAASPQTALPQSRLARCVTAKQELGSRFSARFTKEKPPLGELSPEHRAVRTRAIACALLRNHCGSRGFPPYQPRL
jgi:hypothetical protein